MTMYENAAYGLKLRKIRGSEIAERIRATPVVTATLAADHRVTDGHLGALFLADLAKALQAPEQL